METQRVHTYELHQAVACVWWRSLNEEEPPPDCEAPPRSGWTERSAQTQRERSGRSLEEDDNTQRGSKQSQHLPDISATDIMNLGTV